MTELNDRGYAIAPLVVDPREVSTVARAIERLALRSAGTRNLLGQPWCRALVQRVRNRLAGSGDLSVPVRAPVEHPSLGAWSRKEGVHFVQPPIEVLERMVAVRVHIDDCGIENGPLKVVPGSHTACRLGTSDALGLRAALGEEECLAESGEALIMRPLLLHASSKARTPSRRRVLHMLFGPTALPHGLQWKQAV